MTSFKPLIIELTETDDAYILEVDLGMIFGCELCVLQETFLLGDNPF